MRLSLYRLLVPVAFLDFQATGAMVSVRLYDKHPRGYGPSPYLEWKWLTDSDDSERRTILKRQIGDLLYVPELVLEPLEEQMATCQVDINESGCTNASFESSEADCFIKSLTNMNDLLLALRWRAHLLQPAREQWKDDFMNRLNRLIARLDRLLDQPQILRKFEPTALHNMPTLSITDLVMRVCFDAHKWVSLGQ